MALPEAGSGDAKVRRRFTAIAVAFQIERYGLAVTQLMDPGAVQRSHVGEHMLGPMRRSDEAKILVGVDPINAAIGQRALARQTPGSSKTLDLQ